MMSEGPAHRLNLDSWLTELDIDEQMAFEWVSATLCLIRRVQMRIEGIQTFPRSRARSHWLHDWGRISVKS